MTQDSTMDIEVAKVFKMLSANLIVAATMIPPKDYFNIFQQKLRYIYTSNLWNFKWIQTWTKAVNQINEPKPWNRPNSLTFSPSPMITVKMAKSTANISIKNVHFWDQYYYYLIGKLYWVECFGRGSKAAVHSSSLSRYRYRWSRWWAPRS